MIDSTQPAYVPTDAELQQMVYGNQYHSPEPGRVPASEEVQRYSQQTDAQRDADFERFKEVVKSGSEHDFVLGHDELDPEMFDNNQTPAEHGQVTTIETADVVSDDERTRQTVERMSEADQAKMIRETGRFVSGHVRPLALEASIR